MKSYDAPVNGKQLGVLSGFLVSGFLFSLVGALLPAWGYDISSEYALAGRHFLAIVLGIVITGVLIGSKWRPSTRVLLVSGCGLAASSLLALSAFPISAMWRISVLFFVGAAASLLHAGLFEAMLPSHDQASATPLNIAGVFFGGGAILSTLLVSGVFWVFSVQGTLAVLATIPAGFAVFYATRVFSPPRMVAHPQVLKQFRSGAALLFSLLLFFQFGNEWSIASWLPVFLIHRLGMSPVGALQMLAFYFAALTMGRIATSSLLRSAPPRRVLIVSATASLVGCMILAATNNRLGASVSIVLLGLGFAPIYPLVAAWMSRRFPYYHPGYFNGIFSIALAGGMLTPWLIGEIANRAGIWTIITLPAAGTCMVVLLVIAIWVEQRVTGI